MHKVQYWPSFDPSLQNYLENKKANFSYLLGKYQLKNISAFSFVLMFVIHFDRFCNSYRLVNISPSKFKDIVSNLPSPLKYNETFFLPLME